MNIYTFLRHFQCLIRRRNFLFLIRALMLEDCIFIQFWNFLLNINYLGFEDANKGDNDKKKYLLYCTVRANSGQVYLFYCLKRNFMKVLNRRSYFFNQTFFHSILSASFLIICVKFTRDPRKKFLHISSKRPFGWILIVSSKPVFLYGWHSFIYSGHFCSHPSKCHEA